MRKKKNSELESVSYQGTNIENKELYSISRWAALIEAVNIVGDKCDEKGIKFDETELKPIAIEKYVDQTADLIYRLLSENKEYKLQ